MATRSRSKKTKKAHVPKKRIAILLAIIAVAVAIIVVAFTIPNNDIFVRKQEPERAANAFMKALQSGTGNEAYLSASEAFRNTATAEDFTVFIERYPILTQYDELTWQNTSVRGNMATVMGEVRMGEETSPISVSLTFEEETWRVLNVNLNPQTSGGQ